MDDIGSRPAFGYLRKRAGRNVDEAERRAVHEFAANIQAKIIAEYSGDLLNDVDNSCGFASLLKRIEVTGVSTIIIASAQSLDDDPLVQGVVQGKLAEHGIALLTADASAFDMDASKTATRILNLASLLDGAFKKANLRANSERLRTKLGPKRRRSYAEMCPEVVALAKRVYREQLKTGRPLSLREISARLAQNGLLTEKGKQYHPEAIKRMIKGPRVRGLVRYDGTKSTNEDGLEREVYPFSRAAVR